MRPVSLDEYQESLIINSKDYQFYALILAAMRQADSDNIELLKGAFPDVWDSFMVRYKEPFGVVPEWDGITTEQFKLFRTTLQERLENG